MLVRNISIWFSLPAYKTKLLSKNLILVSVSPKCLMFSFTNKSPADATVTLPLTDNEPVKE